MIECNAGLNPVQVVLFLISVSSACLVVVLLYRHGRKRTP